MKKAIVLTMAAVGVLALAACAKKAEAPAAEAAQQTENVNEETSAQTAAEETYESEDGWKITYSPENFLMTEDNGEVSFSYQGDAAGSNVVAISYYPDKLPSEVLYDKTGKVDDAKVSRSEGWFGGFYPAWSYTRDIAPGDEGSGLGETYIGTEHNGGTLLVEVLYHSDSDEERSTTTSDQISGLLDSLCFTKHDPQQELAYMVGTYVREYTEEIEGEEIACEDKVILNEDHNGTISCQDDIPIIWSSYEIIGRESDYRTEFNVEGDMLYLKEGEEWIEFERQE